jgi:hypothetical protein
MDDRLTFILRTPSVVERAVREALRRALAARRLRDDPPDVRAFSNLALLALERRTRESPGRTDPVGRHELEAATLRAAACFAASGLARRLFRIPPQRLAPGPRGADLAVRDAHGGVHLVRLETFRTAQERLAALDAVAKVAAAQPLRERPALHFFSLLDGTFRSYPSAAAAPMAAPAKRRMRRVA